jgi:PD-(D/E)XK endonuclease
MKNNPKAVGERSEAMVLAGLLKNGEVVLQPFGDNQRYDLVVERDGKFLRVQCKTGRLKNGCVRFYTRSVNYIKGKVVKEAYYGQADIFGVYCPDNDKIYLVPVDQVGKDACHLRIDPAKKFAPHNTGRDASAFELKACSSMEEQATDNGPTAVQLRSSLPTS